MVFIPFEKFHSYEVVTITGEGVPMELMVVEQRGFFSVSHCDKGRSFRWSSPWTRDTHCCTFDSGTVTTVLNTTGVFRKRGSNPDLR